MNKKQRNKKLVSQNKRNKMINRRYRSTVKTLFKLFCFKTNTANIESKENLEIRKTDNQRLLNNLYSVIDKGTKKGVIPKNTAARKKSKLAFLYRSFSNKSIS
jgi:ribosomal protein S20